MKILIMEAEISLQLIVAKILRRINDKMYDWAWRCETLAYEIKRERSRCAK